MAQKAFGTVLKVGDGGGPESFTTIAEILSVTPNGVSSGTIDTTHMETSGGYRTFISDTFKDNGEVVCEIQYDPADLATLRAHVAVLKNWELHYPDGSKDAFAGICTTFAPADAGLEGKLTGSLTVKVSGDITETPAGT